MPGVPPAFTWPQGDSHAGLSPSRVNLGRAGFASGRITATAWPMIVTALPARRPIRFHQTSIGYAAGRFVMDATQTGIAFA